VARLFPTRGARPLAVLGETRLGDDATHAPGAPSRPHSSS
jgi:hypothetical protein